MKPAEPIKPTQDAEKQQINLNLPEDRKKLNLPVNPPAVLQPGLHESIFNLPPPEGVAESSEPACKDKSSQHESIAPSKQRSPKT